MLSLRLQLTNLFADAFEGCGFERKWGEVVVSQRPDLCQFQCNGAMGAAKSRQKNPRELGQAVVDRLKQNPIFKELSLAGAGFINIILADQFLSDHVQALSEEQELACSKAVPASKVIIDFGGPNVAKSMHVGHLRSAIIGDCLQRLFRFKGEQVKSDIHLGDWGTQMGMLICELQRRQPELSYFNADFSGSYPEQSPVSITDLEEMYPLASGRCKEDEAEAEKARIATMELQQGRLGYRALWQHFVDVSVAGLKKDFAGLGVNFDLWFGESYYQERIPAMVERLKKGGFAQESEGALIVSLDQPAQGGEIPPLMLIKSDGGYLYATTDLATVEQRVSELHSERIIYVVDKRQGLHFKQVFGAAVKTGIAGTCRLDHIAFGTVNGKDGKPYKTRAGGVMKLKDLIQMATDEAQKKMSQQGVAQEYSQQEKDEIAIKVGIAALKFADLVNHRLTDYIFDLDKFTSFEGKTGPYHLYAAVRIKSILRKTDEKGLKSGKVLAATDKERELMLALAGFADAVESTYAKCEPHHLCEFAYSLAQSFSRFYQQCHILNESDASVQASWLTLCRLCLKELEQVLYFLGIEIPERM